MYEYVCIFLNFLHQETTNKQITDYLEKHFRRFLMHEGGANCNAQCHPKADILTMIPPKLDQFITDFALKSINRARDTSLLHIQGSLLHAVNPLVNVWADLIEQKLDGDPDALIPVSDVLDMIQRSVVIWSKEVSDVLDMIQKSVVFLGNTNNLISETKRDGEVTA